MPGKRGRQTSKVMLHMYGYATTQELTGLRRKRPDQFSGGAVWRRSTILNPSGKSNSFESGSDRIRFVAVNVCVPIRGSERLESRLNPNFGENQNSRSIIIFRSFPNKPGL